MNSRTVAYLIVSELLVQALCGSNFQLIKSSGKKITNQGSSSTGLLHKAFFQCDRDLDCTHVIQRNETEEYAVLYGEIAEEEMNHLATVWKKVTINVPRMNTFYFI